MRIHIIIDPKGKVDSKLPEDLMKRDDIRCATIDLPEAYTRNWYRKKLEEVLDMMFEVKDVNES